MSIFLQIIGWVVLLFAAFVTFLLGQAIFSNTQLVKRNVEVMVPLWIDLSMPVLATLLQIFLIENVWLAVVIWAPIGIIAGYVAEYTCWRLGLYRPRSSIASPAMTEVHTSSAITEVHRTAVRGLLEACPEVKVWMRNDTSPPMKRIREIGENLNAQGGKKLMQEVHAEFVKSGGRQWARHIEMMWSGIGKWSG